MTQYLNACTITFILGKGTKRRSIDNAIARIAGHLGQDVRCDSGKIKPQSFSVTLTATNAPIPAEAVSKIKDEFKRWRPRERDVEYSSLAT